MRAIVYDRGLKFLNDYPKPVPAEGEALVEVSVAGICNTDIEITRGYMGFAGVIGHEFVGVVRETHGAAGHALLDRRVVGEINCGCGKCVWCQSGIQNHCASRSVVGILGRDGAMADYLVLPVNNLLEVPGNVSDEEAVFAEPLAAAFEIADQVCIRPTDRVLVMGDGKLGLLCSLVLALCGAEVSLLGKHEEKMRIARECGIGTIPLAGLRKERAFDIVVEATGSAEGFELAASLVRPRGTVVLKSTVAGGREMNLAPLVIDEITVVGSRCGPFGPALRALSSGRVDVKPMISGVFRFESAADAFKKAQSAGTLKVLIDFRGMKRD